MPDRNELDIFHVLSALGAFGQGPQGFGPNPQAFLPGLVRESGVLDSPRRWGHVVPYRGAPGQFEFGAALPLAGALSALPDTTVFNILRALSPAVNAHAVAPNPWRAPHEYGVGISGGWRW